MADGDRGGRRPIEEILQDDEAITEALGRGVRNALRIHKRLGHSIVCWEDGKVVTIPPERIEVDEPHG